MRLHRLGSTELMVSPIGLGTVKFGRNEGVKYPQPFDLPTDKDITHLLEVARELGINFLDTAPAYGKSEERLGQLINRKDWIISTKVGEEFLEGKSYFDFSKSALQRSVEKSLKRLRTDYLDVVLVHSNGDDKRIIREENVFATLEELKVTGKIRAYGMSSKTVAGGLLAAQLSDVVMVTFNPHYLDEREVIAFAHKKNKGVLIKKALGSGHLKASDAMQFVLQEPGVSSIIIGTLNPKHLRENVNYCK